MVNRVINIIVGQDKKLLGISDNLHNYIIMPESEFQRVNYGRNIKWAADKTIYEVLDANTEDYRKTFIKVNDLSSHPELLGIADVIWSFDTLDLGDEWVRLGQTYSKITQPPSLYLDPVNKMYYILVPVPTVNEVTGLKKYQRLGYYRIIKYMETANYSNDTCLIYETKITGDGPWRIEGLGLIPCSSPIPYPDDDLKCRERLLSRLVKIGRAVLNETSMNVVYKYNLYDFKWKEHFGRAGYRELINLGNRGRALRKAFGWQNI